MPFSKLGLPPSLINGVKAMGYTDPTPIQLRAIPVVLGGGDLIIEGRVEGHVSLKNHLTIEGTGKHGLRAEGTPGGWGNIPAELNTSCADTDCGRW